MDFGLLYENDQGEYVFACLLALFTLAHIAQMICKASRIGLSTQPNKIDQLQRHKKFKELSQLYPLPQTLGTF